MQTSKIQKIIDIARFDSRLLILKMWINVFFGKFSSV